MTIASGQLASRIARSGLQGALLACCLCTSSVGDCNKGAKQACSVSSAGGVLGFIMQLALDDITFWVAQIIVWSTR